MVSAVVVKMGCVFCDIISGKIRSYGLYSDEYVVAILDINPANPGHCLVISKKHYTNILDAPPELLAHMIIVAKKLSVALVEVLKADGINIIITNNRAAGQTVMHLHIHVIPRFIGDGIRFKFRPKKLTEDELIDIRNRLSKVIAR